MKANEVIPVSAHLHLWHLYDASVKAELFSTAVENSGGILVVDPVPLQAALLEQLIDNRSVVGIFVTNANHGRASADFAEKLAAPIFVHSAARAACESPLVREVTNGEKISDDIQGIGIQGAAAGEMALYHNRDEGTLIVGDALINFEPYGFALLPPKYCANAKEMRRSLRRLLDYNFERMLFAHGTPLMHSARKKLEQLLQSRD